MSIEEIIGKIPTTTEGRIWCEVSSTLHNNEAYIPGAKPGQYATVTRHESNEDEGFYLVKCVEHPKCIPDIMRISPKVAERLGLDFDGDIVYVIMTYYKEEN